MNSDLVCIADSHTDVLTKHLGTVASDAGALLGHRRS